MGKRQLLSLTTYTAGVVAAWLAWSLPGCVTVEGTLKLSGGPLGELEFKPTTCKSGQHLNFLGADLFAAQGEDPAASTKTEVAAFRVVNGVVLHNPGLREDRPESNNESYLRIINDVVRGPLVRFSDARLATGYLQFTPELCQVLSVSAEHRLSRPQSTEGALHLQCALPDGTRASGELFFQQCY